MVNVPKVDPVLMETGVWANAVEVANITSDAARMTSADDFREFLPAHTSGLRFKSDRAGHSA